MTVTMVITLAFRGTVKSATVQQRLRVELRVPRPVKDNDLCYNSPGHVIYLCRWNNYHRKSLQ